MEPVVEEEVEEKPVDKEISPDDDGEEEDETSISCFDETATLPL